MSGLGFCFPFPSHCQDSTNKKEKSALEFNIGFLPVVLTPVYEPQPTPWLTGTTASWVGGAGNTDGNPVVGPAGAMVPGSVILANSPFTAVPCHTKISKIEAWIYLGAVIPAVYTTGITLLLQLGQVSDNSTTSNTSSTSSTPFTVIPSPTVVPVGEPVLVQIAPNMPAGTGIKVTWFAGAEFAQNSLVTLAIQAITTSQPNPIPLPPLPSFPPIILGVVNALATLENESSSTCNPLQAFFC